MKDAVELARQSDVAIIVGGLTHEWESEGFEYVMLPFLGFFQLVNNVRLVLSF